MSVFEQILFLHALLSFLKIKISTFSNQWQSYTYWQRMYRASHKYTNNTPYKDSQNISLKKETFLADTILTAVERMTV